jgi:hypothetical protein
MLSPRLLFTSVAACTLSAFGPATRAAEVVPDRLEHNHACEPAPAEVVLLPPLKIQKPAAGQPRAATASPPSAKPAATPARLPAEAGYPTVLTGTLDRDLELGPERSPVLVCGKFVVAAGVTLKLRAGVCLRLRAETPQPETPQEPAPNPNAELWVWGTLVTEGVTGNPVELACDDKTPATVLLYGAAQHTLDGLRARNVSLVQTAGVSLWTNCELVNVPHYALAGGASLFTHCSFRDSGGLFATYNAAPWSLLVRRCLFDGCREGLVLGSDPGGGRLIVQQNNFTRPKGAYLRAMSVAGAKPVYDARGKRVYAELLVGENWYSAATPEEAELRLVDCRNDATVHARLNTRPPAERPYPNTGAGVTAAVLNLTEKEQQAHVQRILRAHPVAPPVKTAEKPEATVMSKTAARPK